MADVQVASTPPLFVGWSCRRCGHTGGSARCCIPVNASWDESMMRELYASLRRKLVKIHARESVGRGKPCMATYEDFVIYRGGVPEEKTVMGLV